MRLKRLHCRGFKSFADRTEFEFSSSLTGIIGPNGCGKSNVVDALKWVLGDQRARSLRGKEMTDVIFKGAEGRDPMSTAEVEIVLEDEQGLLDGRTEVSIGRRLTSDKESTYLLNGEPVRLKDVRDAMMDTGLGVGAYSVLEQGRIDAVLSANPEDRRAIFEEAAGISKFKIQKRETLRKLDRTEQNLSRVKDLLEERGRRIRGLKIQAGKAKRFRELRSELRGLRAALAVLEARRLRAERSDRQTEFDELTTAAQAAESLHAESMAALAVVEQELSDGRTALEDVQSKVHEVRRRLDSATQRAEAQRERATELAEDAEQCARRRTELRSQHDEHAQSLASARDRLTELEAAAVELHKTLEQRQSAMRAAQTELGDLQSRREQARGRVLEWLHQKTRARNRAHDDDTQLRSVDARRGRLLARSDELAAEIEDLRSDGLRLRDVLADLMERRDHLAADETTRLDELERADRDAADFVRRESELREKLSAVSGRADALAEMEAHMEGLDSGPRHLLAKQAAGLRGRLLDLLEVDVDYSSAVEAALGPYVQALVVDSRENADAMLRELTEGGHGRAILLIEEEFRDEFDHVPPFDLPAEARFLAPLVRCPETARGLVNWLLRGVCLVPTLHCAVPERHDLCFVTLGGELLCGPRIEGGSTVAVPRAADPDQPAASLRTASSEGQGGLVLRKAQIRELRAAESELRQELDGLLGGRKEAEARVERLKQQAQRLASALQSVRTKEHEALGKQGRVEGRLVDLERERSTVVAELDDLGRQRFRAIAGLGQHLFDTKLLTDLEQREATTEREATAALAEVQERVQTAQQAEQQVRLQQVATTTDRDGVLGTIRVHEQNLRDHERALEELTGREEAARDGVERAKEETRRCGEEAEELTDTLSEAEEQREQRADSIHSLQAQRDERRAQLEQLDAERVRSGEQVTQLRLKLSDLDHTWARVEDRLREETGLELRWVLGEVTGIGLCERVPFGPALPASRVRPFALPAEPEFELESESSAPRSGPWLPVDSVLRVGLYAPPPKRDGDAAVRFDVDTIEVLSGPPLPPTWVEEAESLERLWEAENFDETASRKQAKLLQNQVDRLGHVNLDAVAELEEVEESFVFLEREVSDLAESRKGLMETLRRLEGESRSLFEQTFEEARKNFQVIFRKLFQGGKADMFLGDGDDALEAGIDIVAKPPGKELQSINLLSGGERSMTALAILFALFKVKPSPFCVLDEVDAALDETNVERFLRVLQDFVGPTQFCIVTHHKRTMAECQSLYGITMQRRGVSSRIAVSLDEVDAVTEGAASAGAAADAVATRERIAGEEPVGF